MQSGGVTSKINQALNSHAVNSPLRFPKAASLKVVEQRKENTEKGGKGRKQETAEARNKKSIKGEGGKTGKQKRKEK